MSNPDSVRVKASLDLVEDFIFITEEAKNYPCCLGWD